MSRRRTRGRTALPVSVVFVLLFLFLPASVQVPAAGLAGCVLALFLGALFWFGLRHTGGAFVMAGMAFAPMTSVVLPGATFITVSDLLMLIGFLLLVPTMVGTPLTVSWQWVVGVGGFFLVGLLASLNAADQATSFSGVIRIVIANGAFPLLILWWGPRGRTLYAFVFAYALGAAFNALYAASEGAVVGNRYNGLSEQPTGFGFSCLLGLSLLPFLLTVTRRERRWLVLALAPCLLFGIWVSGSRASLLLLILLLAVFPIREKSIKAFGAVAVVAVGVLAMLPSIEDTDPGEANALSRLLGGGGSTGSNKVRYNGLIEALHDWKNHPIVGGGFDQSFEAHNLYVQLLLFSGVLGLVTFLLMLWAVSIPFLTAARPYGLLAYPSIAYVLAGPITPNMGSRFITVLLALSLIVASMERRGEIGSLMKGKAAAPSGPEVAPRVPVGRRSP